jgi:hypothetical protein
LTRAQQRQLHHIGRRILCAIDPENGDPENRISALLPAATDPASTPT